MKKLSQIGFNIQGFLFPFIEKEIEEPLTEKLKQLVATLELIWIEDFVHIPDYWHGQSTKNRKQIARSFVAKAVYNMTTTRELIDRLKTTPALRRICGWERASQIPHESSFSRAFAEFAQNGIARIVHESCVKQHQPFQGHTNKLKLLLFLPNASWSGRKSASELHMTRGIDATLGGELA